MCLSLWGSSGAKEVRAQTMHLLSMCRDDYWNSLFLPWGITLVFRMQESRVMASVSVVLLVGFDPMARRRAGP